MAQNGSMRERRPGVWELRVGTGKDPVTVKYTSRTKSFHGGKREARNELTALVAEVNKGEHRRSMGSFAYLLERWLEHNEAELSPTTLREYRRLVKRRIVPELGPTMMAKLTAGDLDGFYLTLRREGLSPASIHQIHAVIRRALAQGVKWGLVTSNVAADASPPTVRVERRVPPSPEVVRRLVAAEKDEEMSTLFRVAIASGARRGELCGLRWIDLDFEEATVMIRGAVVAMSEPTRKSTKTHAERTVPIDPATVKLLETHREAMEKRAADAGYPMADEAYVFSSSPDGLLPWNPDSVTAAFRALCKAQKVKGVRFHDLRHAHATWLLDAGVPLHTVSERLGHAKASTTSDIYGHPIDARSRTAADLLGGLLEPED